MATLHLIFSLFSTVFWSSSLAYNFNVGGKNGWVSNPSENYNHWAERNRFQVNDTLSFRYKKGLDSVLVVKKDDYYSCNPNNPIMKMDSGTSVFKFDHSGPFFFITGNKNNCEKGQRLIVVVLAIRPPKSFSPSPPPSAISPTSSPSPVSPSPKSPSLSPSYAPKSSSPSSSISPSPAAHSPMSSSPSPSSSLSPPAANSPKSSSPSPSPYSSLPPSQAANSPQSSSPSPSPSPSSSLSPSPEANSPESSSPSPAAEGPVISPSAGPVSPETPPSANSPAFTPGGSGSGETADENAPAPTESKSGSQAVTGSSGMMLMAVGVAILSVVNGI